MAASQKRKKQDFNRVSATKVGEIAVGCVEKHGLMKPISLPSVKQILKTAKQVMVEYHSESILSALDDACRTGKIHKIVNYVYLADQRVRNCVERAMSILSNADGSTYHEIIDTIWSFPPSERVHPKKVKTFLKIGLDVDLVVLKQEQPPRYGLKVRQGQKRKRRKRRTV